jgi:signal transduction histidine kinase
MTAGVGARAWAGSHKYRRHERRRRRSSGHRRIRVLAIFRTETMTAGLTGPISEGSVGGSSTERHGGQCRAPRRGRSRALVDRSAHARRALAAVMDAYLTTLDHAPLLAVYFLFVPAYTVAAWQAGRQAVLALAFLLGSTASSELIAHHQPIGNRAGAAFTISAAWSAGGAIRARRSLASELQRTSARLAAEREDRAQLAVAGERSRIASELHAVVARSVAAMVVQGARSVLVHDPARADAAMGAIEDTGRQTLAEMRRILGVLRPRRRSRGARAATGRRSALLLDPTRARCAVSGSS